MGEPRERGAAFDLRITHATIDLTIDPARGSLSETATLELAGHDVTEIPFVLDGSLVVKTSRTSSGVVEHRQAGDKLIVDLDPPLSGSRTLTFTIAGEPGARGGSRIDASRAVLAPGLPFYPGHAGFWATTEVAVHAPAGWTAVAPGALAARSGGGAFRWTTTHPIRSIAIAAAPRLELAEASLVTTPLRLATPSSGTMLKAIAARLSPAMAWLSGALAPYPFDGVNVVLLPGFPGRVEASGMVVVGRELPLANDSDGADLLTGQWFGQSLAGDGAWIGAFAAWEGCVFAHDRALPIPADVTAQRVAYFALRSGDVALERATASTPAEVVRGKGSAAPDMIRLVAGDRAMFDAVRELFAAPFSPPLPLARVRETIEKHAGRSLQRSFDDWFGRAGAPEFEASVRSFPASGGGFRADVAVTQKRGAYALPVDVVVYGPGDERRETIEVADETTSVFYIVPFEPKRIEVDPLDRIFRRK